jgi:D-glycero-alpha-D-manno-heptose 1-phosphate guanylyltransferase
MLPENSVNQIATAVVLAGGLGTRLRSEVPELPKPMAPVAGRPFLEHLISYWAKQGISRFVLSVGYRHEAISEFFGTKFLGAQIEYVVEETPLGTGGGLLLAVQTLPQDRRFLLLNGDTYFAVGLNALTEFAVAHDADWCFSLFRPQETGRYMGMTLSPEGRIRSLKSGTGHPSRLANGGVYAVHPRSLVKLPFSPDTRVSLEDDIFECALKVGQILVGLECDGRFIDIGVPMDYRRASDVIERNAGNGMNISDRLKKNLLASIESKRQLSEDGQSLTTFTKAVEAVIRCCKSGGRIYIAGNGGSAADAQHLAAEFVSKLARDRAPIAAEALTVDTSIITAIGNDYGFDKVFSRQLEGKATDKDVFLGITTSGQSPNILLALEQCRKMGIPSIVFCGRDGGGAKAKADYCVIAPGAATSTIQELHILLAHTLCESVEVAIFGE